MESNLCLIGKPQPLKSTDDLILLKFLKAISISYSILPINKQLVHTCRTSEERKHKYLLMDFNICSLFS